MKTYTVIGIYDSTGQVYASSAEANDPFEAMRLVAHGVAEDDRDDLQIICAVEGDLSVRCPCDDSGKTAYASDLTDEEG